MYHRFSFDHPPAGGGSVAGNDVKTQCGPHGHPQELSKFILWENNWESIITVPRRTDIKNFINISGH